MLFYVLDMLKLHLAFGLRLSILVQTHIDTILEDLALNEKKNSVQCAKDILINVL